MSGWKDWSIVKRLYDMLAGSKPGACSDRRRAFCQSPVDKAGDAVMCAIRSDECSAGLNGLYNEIEEYTRLLPFVPDETPETKNGRKLALVALAVNFYLEKAEKSFCASLCRDDPRELRRFLSIIPDVLLEKNESSDASRWAELAISAARVKTEHMAQMGH